MHEFARDDLRDARNAGVVEQYVPIRKAGIDVPDEESPTSAAVDVYRQAVIKAAKAGKVVDLPQAVLQAAQRTPRDAKADIELAIRRFSWAADRRRLPKEIERAATSEGAPAPTGARLADLLTVADFEKARARYHEERIAWECAPRTSPREALQEQLRAAERGLRETADVALTQQINSLRKRAKLLHSRRDYWEPIVAEVDEIARINENIRRWGNGQLSESERLADHPDPTDAILPDRAARKAEATRLANERRLDKLLKDGRARLALLQSRGELHARAKKEIAAVDRELTDLQASISATAAEQLQPERLRWTA